MFPAKSWPVYCSTSMLLLHGYPETCQISFQFADRIGPQKRTVHKEMWWPKHLVFVGYIFSCDTTIVFMSRHNFLVPLSVFSVFFRWLCVSVLIKTDSLFLFVILWILHDKHKQKREEIKWIESFKLKCV